jgi:hypothetical protein
MKQYDGTQNRTNQYEAARNNTKEYADIHSTQSA